MDEHQPPEQPPQAPTITLHVHVHIDKNGSPTVNTTSTPPQRAVDPPHLGPSHLDTCTPAQLLAIAGVRNPATYLHRYAPDRIREVVRAAFASKRHNVGGWIATALEKRWNVQGNASAAPIDGEK